MNNKWSLEILWWLITIILTVLIMLPIYTNVGSNYPYYTANVAFIFVFLTFTRYIFLLRYAPFSHSDMVKGILIFIPIPLFFYFIDALYDFQRFLDEEGLVTILGNLNSEAQFQIAKYIQYEKLFFGSGAIITLVLFPIRMIVSIWRVRNRGTV